MRQIVLDTETTGLDWRRGNRVVEIGAIELLERRRSGRFFHRYLNPQREFEQGASNVTGLDWAKLADEPTFDLVAAEFLAFIEGAELVIHNAEFDVGFLDAELRQWQPAHPGLRAICTVTDTLAIARERYPGQRNSLDALCKRLEVDNRHRQLHGARLDADLLVEVYLAMTAGQGDLVLMAEPTDANGRDGAKASFAALAVAGPRPRVQVLAEESRAHRARLEQIRGKASQCLWDAIATPLPAE
jgi:DNA polymerase-3 subunit epsilon